MPSWDPRQIQWVKLDDFGPGVADRDYNATGTIGPWPLGTAVATQTFRCRALPNGALAPLPLRETQFTMAFPAPIVAATPVEIVGFHIQGGVREPGVSGGYDEANWFVAMENLQTLTLRRFRLLRIRQWSPGPTIDSLVDATDPFAQGVHRTCYIDSTRVAAADPTVPGFPAIAFGWFGDFGAGKWGFFPDPAAPTTLVPSSVGSIYNPGPMVVYQGRSVIGNRQDFANGTGTILYQTNENIFFMNSNLKTLATVLASLFTPEDPGEIMAMQVSAANELFVLKRRHGGYVIRGDISFPTVLRLPGIQGAGKMPQQPLASPIGIVYNSSRSGIHIWAGATISELISPQLEPANFEYALQGNWEYGKSGGRPDFHEDLIFVPPFWAYSYRTKAWWRLEDPADTQAPNGYLYFQNSINQNSMIACRGEMNAPGENFAFAYNFDKAAQSYQWRSQPIAPIISLLRRMRIHQLDNDVIFREVILRATGVAGSTVVVRLISLGVTESHSFTLTGASTTNILRDNSNLRGGDLQIQIEADGGAGNPAPIVYEVRVGYNPIDTAPEIGDV